MSLPLWKAVKILNAGGFNAALMKEAQKVVNAAEVVEAPEKPVYDEEPVIEAP